MGFYGLLQKFKESFSEIFSFEPVFDLGLEIVELVADIVSLSLNGHGVNGLLLSKRIQGVGELNLIVFAGRQGFENVENLRREDIAAGDGEGGPLWRGYLWAAPTECDPASINSYHDTGGLDHRIYFITDLQPERFNGVNRDDGYDFLAITQYDLNLGIYGSHRNLRYLAF
jgi:hypothetical protein